MLNARHRLRRSADFSAVIRSGARSGRGAVVVHLLPASADAAQEPSLVGFVVSRTVGNAVVRNRVTRRLRALCQERIARSELFPPGSRVVIRALPAAAVTPYAELGAQLESALRRSVDRSADLSADRSVAHSSERSRAEAGR